MKSESGSDAQLLRIIVNALESEKMVGGTGLEPVTPTVSL